MLTLSGNSEGSVLEYNQAKGEIVNSERYCVLLTDEPKPVSTRSKRTFVSKRNSAAR
jgi:hypothetical protein